MTGLTLALRLAQKGRKVTLVEAADELGGLASPWRIGDVVWDRHYHVTLLSDQNLRGLLSEIGLEKDMRWVVTRTGCYAEGDLYSISNSLEFLLFPHLSLIHKLRLGATMAYASRVKNWRALERIPVKDWLTRLSGRTAFERFWMPLLRAKLGDNWQEASAAFIWATIARLYAARRSGMKREMFGYVPGGYRRVVERFGEVLASLGVRIQLATPVQRVQGTTGGVEVTLQSGTVERFDAAVVTLAAPLAARLCPTLEADESSRLRGVRYQGVVCASCLLDRPLGGYYVTNILDGGVPFTGVIEMTALVDPAELGGSHLVYLPKYVPEGDEFFQATDDEVREKFLPALEAMFPSFRRSQVKAFRVSRVRQVCAVPTLGYSERVPPVTTSIPGLYLLGSANIVNATLNVNESVRLAEQMVQQWLS